MSEQETTTYEGEVVASVLLPSGTMQLPGLVRSPDVSELMKAMSPVQASLKPYTRSAAAHNYKYTPLDVIMEDLAPRLGEAGITLVYGCEDVDVKTTRIWAYVFHNDTGQFIGTGVSMQSSPGPKDVGSLITYGRRYSLMIFGTVVSDSDDDAGRATPKGTSTSASRNSSTAPRRRRKTTT